jgi:anthranilate phosphoribosyltransferase
MQSLIDQLKAKRPLGEPEIEAAVQGLLAPEIAGEQKGEFLKALRAKGETAEELAGFVKALLAHSIDPGLSAEELPGPMIDLCGTGGDQLGLFNISTTCMFVVAAGGAVVVKHGNRGITSKCGGADVLEALEVRIDLTPAQLQRSVKETGLGFLFAPLYHPAFKMIAPVRKALAAQGIATIFNLLGPLLNPARPPHQLVGIFSPDLLPLYAKALALLDRRHAWAVHGAGMDELSTLGNSEVHAVRQDGVNRFLIDPAEFGFSAPTLSQLQGGDKDENAAILTGILDGSVRGPKRDIVVLNSAAALVIANLAPDLAEGIALAEEQLHSGKALGKLRQVQALHAALY